MNYLRKKWTQNWIIPYHIYYVTFIARELVLICFLFISFRNYSVQNNPHCLWYILSLPLISCRRPIAIDWISTVHKTPIQAALLNAGTVHICQTPRQANSSNTPGIRRAQSWLFQSTERHCFVNKMTLNEKVRQEHSGLVKKRIARSLQYLHRRTNDSVIIEWQFEIIALFILQILSPRTIQDKYNHFTRYSVTKIKQEKYYHLINKI